MFSKTGRLHTTFQGLPASPRDLRCYEYTHAIAFCRNQKKRPGAESERWAGIGHVAVGMARQGYDLQLTWYDEKGWGATFYTTGMEHSPTGATGTGWERTPWHATQRAAWAAVRE
jgi:hypothetical protein